MNTSYGLSRALLLNPDRIAVRFEDRARTFAELADRVARLAGALAALGVGRSDRVAVLSLKQDRYLKFYLGIAWAGAVIVPLNIRWSPGENADAIRDSRPRILIVDAAFAAQGQEIARGCEVVTLVYADDAPAPARGMEDYERLIAETAPAPEAQARDDDLAGIFYTGGTTGRSKSVMLSHRNLMSNARNMVAERLGSSEASCLYVAPMFHIATGAAMYWNRLAGGSHAVVRVFSPEAVAKAIERFRITDLPLVPTMIQMFVDDQAIAKYDLSSLRTVAYGGSPISEAVLDRAVARLPSVQFVQLYGMTELSPCATILKGPDHIGDGRAKGRHRSGGRPVLTVDVRVVDPMDRPVAPGVVGEIVARGETVMLGYWERPEETRKAVVEGWMHTGDGGYLDEDGYLYVVDRIKDMIVTGGENVYSAEVENCIAQHPAVAQCAVIGVPSEQWGETVHAIVTRKPGAPLTADDIIAFAKQRIAGYKCPRSAKIQDETLPLSGAGKILKRELRRPYWEGRARQVS
jgi:long-chain acyl-CoA synthetase